MTSTERRAVGSLASIMSLRLLGLFMILPVFSLYAHNLVGSTPLLIGMAIGIYGLTQGLLQIPFGMLSDHIGRRPVITLGLLLFALGSMIAALSHSITGVIIGRALQGAGAIGSTVIAMIADLTSDGQRTKAMAINGMTIGMSFSLAMVLGPIFAAWIQINGIFWLAVAFSFIALFILYFLVPTPPPTPASLDKEPKLALFFTLLKDPQLARLNSGVFLLNAVFTASFVVLPITLLKFGGLPSNKQWFLYVPTLLIAFVLSVIMIMRAEKKHQVKPFFITGIVLLGISEIYLSIITQHLMLSAFGLLLFFTAFSLLEAVLPSWVSRAAPPARKGTALGIYSSAQFLGIFAGGSLGGLIYGIFGLQKVYLFCAAITVAWLVISIPLKSPQHSTLRQK